MVKTDAEGASTGQELPAELILAYLTSGRRLHLPGAPGRRRSPSGGGRPVASPRQKQDALR